MIKIEMTAQVITRQKKDGSGSYYKQIGYAHILDRDGNQEKYPVKIEVMLSKQRNGEPQRYQPGDYNLAASSLRVDRYGGLEVGFINLVPIKTEGLKKAS